jgi:uncharacterized protein (TIGR03545 family)
VTTPAPAATAARLRIFRWKAIGPLLLFVVALGVLWWLFADRIARDTTEDVGTAMLGARVDIDRLHIDLGRGQVELRGVTVASPFEAFRNLLQAEELVANFDVVALLEKKVVIDRFAANGLRFGTTRATSGLVPREDQAGATRSIGAQVEEWGERFRVPALALAGGALDVGALDVNRLETVGAARALAGRADSSGRAWTDALAALDPRPAVDSARALVERLRTARPTDLALINDARRQLATLQRLERGVGDLERAVRAGIDSLSAGVRELDAARQRDYAFARSLVQLPSFDAPNLAAALFGSAAIQRFQRALYWARLGREYLPPGLRPRETPGRNRARRAGTDVWFPRERAYPGFLLRQGELSFTLAPESDAPKTFAGRIEGLTSAPAIYGRPTTFAATGPSIRIGALVDHVGAESRDTAAAEIGGVRLPTVAIPGLPLRLDAGRGTLGLSFALEGDRLRGAWRVRAPAVTWARDSGAARGSDVQQLVERVLAGIGDIDLEARLGGSLGEPLLAVRSNLDDVLAERLRAVLGEEVAAVEAGLRARVDSAVGTHVTAVRARVTAVSDEAAQRLGVERAQIDQVRQALEQRLRELTRTLPGIRIP